MKTCQPANAGWFFCRPAPQKGKGAGQLGFFERAVAQWERNCYTKIIGKGRRCYGRALLRSDQNGKSTTSFLFLGFG